MIVEQISVVAESWYMIWVDRQGILVPVFRHFILLSYFHQKISVVVQRWYVLWIPRQNRLVHLL